MLRLRPSLILRKAQVVSDPFISNLLPVVGDLSSARNELRWLREGCQKRASESDEQQSLLEQHVSRRSRGEPLQYILGSAYFGDLEIKCRQGVFIPRFVTPDTGLPRYWLIVFVYLGLRPLQLSHILYNLWYCEEQSKLKMVRYAGLAVKLLRSP
jgi:hypothetical protein